MEGQTWMRECQAHLLMKIVIVICLQVKITGSVANATNATATAGGSNSITSATVCAVMGITACESKRVLSSCLHSR